MLAITGFARSADVERAEAEGFFSHVTKPIDVNDLVQTLRELPVKNQQATVTTQN